MKKTLAAVLAAAMALSTASVVLATDFEMDEYTIKLNGDSSTDDVRDTIAYGKEYKALISSVTVDDIGTIDGYDLAEWVDKGYASVTVTVTEGSSKLAGKPAIEIRRINSSSQTTKATHTWNWTIRDYNNNIIVRKGQTVGDIPVFDNNGTWDFITNYGDVTQTADTAGDPVFKINDDVVKYIKKNKDTTNNATYSSLLTSITGNAVTASNDLKEESNKLGNLLRLKFKVTDTYGTSDTTVGMKLRVTIKKSFTDDNGVSHVKGNTYTSDEFRFKAVYYELSDYYDDMQLTLEEVDKRHVKLDASDLYDEIGNDTFTIAFEDVAVFEAKLSAGQKDVNLFYDLDEKTDVTDAYPNVDFEFITFRGNPSFVNSGTMTFNAVGGKNTQVYKYDGEALTPLTGSYDSTYDTVVVKGVKTLGTFVVASEILEEDEPDEPAEPVSSAPVVEGPEEDENPKTGAC